MGMEKEIRDHVFTSGQASLNYLKQNLSTKKFFHVGPPRDFDLFNEFAKMKSDNIDDGEYILCTGCLLYTSPSPRDMRRSRMPSSA